MSECRTACREVFCWGMFGFGRQVGRGATGDSCLCTNAWWGYALIPLSLQILGGLLPPGRCVGPGRGFKHMRLHTDAAFGLILGHESPVVTAQLLVPGKANHHPPGLTTGPYLAWTAST
jgi:hypothetical protein